MLALSFPTGGVVLFIPWRGGRRGAPGESFLVLHRALPDLQRMKLFGPEGHAT